MTVAYVDTSCLVAIAFAEPGHEALMDRLRAMDGLFASNVLEAEFRSALTRESVDEDGGALGVLSWVLPDRALTREFHAVLQAGSLRGADLWHVAAALFLSPDPSELTFLTLDRAQASVAAAVGFSVPSLV